MSTDIDQSARAMLARLLRRLAAGLITNRQFEAALPRSRDPAIQAIWSIGLWPLYDDLFTHKLTGRWRLTRLQRGPLARIVLFLNSGLPYRYPLDNDWTAVPALLLSLMTAGWFGRRRRARRWRDAHASVWPFYSREELAAATNVTATSPAPALRPSFR